MEIEKFNFKSIQEVNEYRFKSITAQSKYFSSIIQGYVKVVSDDMIFYFDKNKKLWTKANKKQFEAFVYTWFDDTANLIKKLIKKSENIDEQVERETKLLIKQFDKKSYINDIIERSFTTLYDVQFYTILDSQPSSMPILNGKKICLKTLKITERTSSDYFTYESPVNFIEGKTPNADKFFKQIMPNKKAKEYLRKILGYSLTGETDARIFMVWFGHGSNGKTLLVKCLDLILGPQYVQCDRSIFMKSKKSGGGATPELMALMGKRMGVYSEGETSDHIEMNLSGLKQISGEDKITGRPLYCQQIEFYPYIKLHMLTNFTPPLNSEKAIKDRLRYIFFDAKFSESKDLKEGEIAVDKEFANNLQTIFLSEIFTWIVKGAKEYYLDRKIEMPESFKIRTNDILSNEDSIKTFLDRKIQFGLSDKQHMKKLQIFELYKNFCNQNSQRCQPRSSLFARLGELGCKLSTLHGYDVYRGIDIKDEIEEDEKSENENVFLI